MKQSILKKLLVSGAAAFGILGLSTPAAFAWSGRNSSYGGYGNGDNHMSYSSEHKNYSPCYNVKSWDSNMYGGKSNGCRDMYANNRNKCDNHNTYGNKLPPYGESEVSYSYNRW